MPKSKRGTPVTDLQGGRCTRQASGHRDFVPTASLGDGGSAGKAAGFGPGGLVSIPAGVLLRPTSSPIDQVDAGFLLPFGRCPVRISVGAPTILTAVSRGFPQPSREMLE
jgi:hypothetical protein